MNQTILLVAVAVLALCGAVALFKRAFVSPLTWIVGVLLSTGVFSLYSLMGQEKGREVFTSVTGQWYFFGISLVCLGTVAWASRPKVPQGFAFLRVRWRYFPEKMWYLFFLALCVLDVVQTVRRTGTVGLLHSAESMGTAGGSAHFAVFSTMTFVAWVAGALAFTALLLDYFAWRGPARAFITENLVKILIVFGCLMLNSLSGNRFMFVFRMMTLIFALSMSGRLQRWMLPTAAAVGILFFVLVGNFRFGQVDIRDQLTKSTGYQALDFPVAWFVSYSEPILPNLDNFINYPPEPQWGMNWFTSVLPGEMVTRLGLERMTAIQYIGSTGLLAHRGQTFRTMYPDLIADFGLVGGFIAGIGIFVVGGLSYKNAFRSPRWFMFFLLYTPAFLFTPLLAGFYSIVNIVPFALFFMTEAGTPAPPPPARSAGPVVSHSTPSSRTP